MRKRIFSLAVIFALIFSFAAINVSAKTVKTASGALIEVVGDNLVKNPSFEQPVGDNPSANPNETGGWTLWGMDGSNFKEMSGAIDGKKVAHIQRIKGGDWATIKQEIPLEAGKTYYFGAYLKAPNGVVFAINLNLYDDNRLFTTFSRQKDANAPEEFQQVSATFSVPAEAINPKLNISASSGREETRMYIDMVEVYEVKDPSSIQIDEVPSLAFSGDMRIILKNSTRPIELKYVGDNTAPTNMYDDRSKYLQDILFNIRRDFGGPDTGYVRRNAVPVTITDKESYYKVRDSVKNNIHNNPIINTQMIEDYISEVIAHRPGFIKFVEATREDARMGIRAVRVTGPWWQYVKHEDKSTNYTADEWKYIYNQLFEDAWKQGLIEGYILSKYCGITDINLGNEPDQGAFYDWDLYSLEVREFADGFRTGVEAAVGKRGTVWDPTLAGWKPNEWEIIGKNIGDVIDIWDYHTYGGGPSNHRDRIRLFKQLSAKYSPDGKEKPVSASEFNYVLSGKTYDHMDKIENVISHIRIMREQAISGLYASMRFSFNEMLYVDSVTAVTNRAQKMVYGIRMFNRAILPPCEFVDYDLIDASSHQEFLATKDDNVYSIFLINGANANDETRLTVDLSQVGVKSAKAVVRETSETKNDEIFGEYNITDGTLVIEKLKKNSMYLIQIQYNENQPAFKPVITRAFGKVDSLELWWSNNKYATSFNVMRKEVGGKWETIKTGLTESYYNDKDVQEGKQYLYKVSAVTFGKVGEETAEVGPIQFRSINSLPYRADFENLKDTGWEKLSGEWTFDTFHSLNGYVSRADVGKTNMAVTGDAENWKDYTMNTTIRLKEFGEDATFGAVFRYMDKNNYYKAELNIKDKKMYLYKIKNGEQTKLGEADISTKYEFTTNEGDRYAITVTVNGGSIYFFSERPRYGPVGERSNSISVTDNDPILSGKAGFFLSNNIKAYFEGINVNELFIDDFQGGEKPDWEKTAGTWITEGVGDQWLTQTDKTDNWAFALTTSGSIADGYMSAKIRINEDGAKGAMIGKFKDDKNYFRYETDGKTISLVRVVNGEEKVLATKDVTPSRHDYVTVTVVFDRGLQRIYTNAANPIEIYVYEPSLENGKFGFASIGGSVSFDEFQINNPGAHDEKAYFSDTADHWAKNEIITLATDGYIKGRADGRYDTEANITRAEFLSLAARTIRLPEAQFAGGVSDVNTDAWYAGTLQAAIDAKIIDPAMLEGGKFNPDAPITREEMTSIVVNVYRYQKNKEPEKADISSYSDTTQVSDWATDYFKGALALGIIKGKTATELVPKDNATRAEAAVMIKRLLDAMNKW